MILKKKVTYKGWDKYSARESYSEKMIVYYFVGIPIYTKIIKT